MRCPRSKTWKLESVVVLLLGFLMFAGAVTVQAKQTPAYYNELLLVRGLAHDVAVAKIPLPWGKHGIHVDANGEINQAQAVKELREKGESIGPGMPVEITAMKFKGNRIVFAINGGGKKGDHWYDHLELGMGMPAPVVSQDNSTTPSNGSYITLTIPRKDPTPSVKKVKELLSEVLDFSRHSPTVLYSPSEPPKFKDAIAKHQVVIGMDRDSVLSAKGAPDRKIRQEKPDGSEEEDWLYGQPPHVLFVIFTDRTVTAIHQY
ncbi:MAG: hypothetical protein ACRD2B_13110 [Terriglobia bacterium]